MVNCYSSSVPLGSFPPEGILACLALKVDLHRWLALPRIQSLGHLICVRGTHQKDMLLPFSGQKNYKMLLAGFFASLDFPLKCSLLLTVLLKNEETSESFMQAVSLFQKLRFSNAVIKR